MVVSLIILIISTTVLLRQAKFNSSTLLRSLSYSVALAVRQAQVYGTSVRESSSGLFGQGYGVYVPATGSDAQNFYIFADVYPAPTGNGTYDAGQSEELPVYTLGQGYYISRLCVIPIGGSTCTTPSSLTVFFRRPNPEACFTTNLEGASACALNATPVYKTAYIEVMSGGNGDSRTVKVTNTGQISVCQPNLSGAALTNC